MHSSAESRAPGTAEERGRPRSVFKHRNASSRPVANKMDNRAAWRGGVPLPLAPDTVSFSSGSSVSSGGLCWSGHGGTNLLAAAKISTNTCLVSFLRSRNYTFIGVKNPDISPHSYRRCLSRSLAQTKCWESHGFPQRNLRSTVTTPCLGETRTGSTGLVPGNMSTTPQACITHKPVTAHLGPWQRFTVLLFILLSVCSHISFICHYLLQCRY